MKKLRGCPASLALLVLLTSTEAWPQTGAGDDSRSTGDEPAAEIAAVGRVGGLTADEVARRARASSLDLTASRAELAAAAADVDRAVAAYVPRLVLTARYTRLSDPGDADAGSIVVAPDAPLGPLAPTATLVNAPLSFPVLLDQWTFQAGLTVPVSDYLWRIPSAHGAARHGELAAARNAHAVERQVEADAKVAYYAWVRARLGVAVAEQALAQTRAHLADVRRAVDAGTASPADPLRVESQLAKSELLVESSLNLSRAAEERLRVVMHDDSRRPYAIGEDPADALPPLPAAEASRLVERGLARRPELEGLREAARARRASANVERAACLPRLDLFADAYYQNPNPRMFPQRDEFSASWDAGAQITWTISDLPGAAAAARAAEARASTMDAQRAALADRIRLEVTRAIDDAREADLAITTAARGLRAAEESYRVRRLAFQNGRATSTELLDAEADLTRARLEVLGARVAARVARVRLAYATGDDLGGSSAPAPSR